MTLNDFFAQNPKAAIGFSGGVDSAYLLYAAKKCGANIQPYYIKTAFQPRFEYSNALRLCRELNVNMKTVKYDILSDSNIASNPQNRCYYCKKIMFGLLMQQASRDGYDLIIDGTNASDNLADRPGAKAIAELGVRSPLRECGLVKDKIRELSKQAGLFTHNMPSYSCLATRIESGTIITAELLEKIEAAESTLSEMGFSDFRARVYNGGVRLEIKHEQFSTAAAHREEILKRIKPYFSPVVLDMETR